VSLGGGSGIVRSGKSKPEFMILLLSGSSGTSRQNKSRRIHQGDGLPLSGGDFIRRVFSPQYRRELSFPVAGPLDLHCQVGQTHFGVIPDIQEIAIALSFQPMFVLLHAKIEFSHPCQ
jgi:hypothetical protein